MVVGLIPRKRLSNIPAHLRERHEYCFFLHDECVRLLKEYEAAKANVVKIKFTDRKTAQKFEKIADTADGIEALRTTGYAEEAKRVIINQITMAMVSDCLHHMFEGLKCFEKRKFIVALNLLRKPLKDNLLYLSWMLGDEEEFYREFTNGNPERLAHSRLGNFRASMFSKAILQTGLGSMDGESLNDILFNRKNSSGLERLFQHAVHLITVQNIELKTSPENFNFIFKRYTDDDIYQAVYEHLPYIVLFLSHVIVGLFNRMRNMDGGSYKAFYVRSTHAFFLIEDRNNGKSPELVDEALQRHIICAHCHKSLKATRLNMLKIMMTESFRCTFCRRNNEFPFSWIFD
ncbi:MAG: DUF4187 domain-containing protein [Micavibrio sp.]|nr:DUF4187 domain-containing protein [Micavibrio sp.]